MSRNAVYSGDVFHTEDKKWIKVYSDGNVHFTEVNEYLVIYYDGAYTNYARPVDMFFEHVQDENNDNKYVRRFNKETMIGNG